MTARFWKLFRDLPEDVQRAAEKNYRVWLENPRHPSIRFRAIGGREDVVTARVSDDYRVLGVLKGSDVTWFWIGPHSEYDKMLAKRP